MVRLHCPQGTPDNRGMMATKKAVPNKIKRASGDTVALTVRLSKDDWKALKLFAAEQGETIQTIAVNAFNRELKAHKRDPLKG